MIRHCAMSGLELGQDPSDLCAVVHGPGDVADCLPGCKNFVFAPNRDLELKSPGYPYGFTLDFDSAADLKRYAGDATTRQPVRCSVRGRWDHGLRSGSA